MHFDYRPEIIAYAKSVMTRPQNEQHRQNFLCRGALGQDGRLANLNQVKLPTGVTDLFRCVARMN